MHLQITNTCPDQHLHFRRVRHPLLPDITLPIVPDAELVDPSFGTGAVKITPSHDINDYAFWKRHSSSSTSPDNTSQENRVDIPLVPVFSSTGHLLPSCGIPSLIGIDRLHARKSFVKLLKDAGVYRGKRDHKMRVGKCERSGCIIEPLLQPQWYLSTKPLAEKVLAQSKLQELIIRPESPHSDEWKRWLEGIHDWCLSRQIWWGHRIPAYRVVTPEKVEERWIVAADEAAAREQLTAEENERGCGLEQDPDVLDTWFSSGLLPLSVAGWRGNKEAAGAGELEWEKNYPLSFIESGGDILFFWLARMAMLCRSTWLFTPTPAHITKLKYDRWVRHLVFRQVAVRRNTSPPPRMRLPRPKNVQIRRKCP